MTDAPAPTGANFPPAAPAPAPGESKFKKAAKAVYDVLISRPVRPYEVAIALAVLKALEQALGFKAF